eukprot:TRINITY_DN4427_c0_g1_i1.p1 TRINITY_DN4427_c0_g1~~TRINITY_DN4427_c0_g1_i1.p1  ORF type:complete len:563 (-),score=133.04 TRINITY_DN4427_c0_g1_i1:45-1733(-)
MFNSRLFLGAVVIINVISAVFFISNSFNYKDQSRGECAAEQVRYSSSPENEAIIPKTELEEAEETLLSCKAFFSNFSEAFDVRLSKRTGIALNEFVVLDIVPLLPHCTTQYREYLEEIAENKTLTDPTFHVRFQHSYQIIDSPTKLFSNGSYQTAVQLQQHGIYRVWIGFGLTPLTKQTAYQSVVMSKILHELEIETDSTPLITEREDFEREYGDKSWLTNPRIYVAVPSLRERDLVPTMDNMYKQAYNQHRLWFGVVEQNKQGDDASTFTANSYPYRDRRVRLYQTDYTNARGLTMARWWGRDLWQGEEYILHVDPHMRWDYGWDVLLLRELFLTKRPHRSVVGTYPNALGMEEAFVNVTTADGSVIEQHVIIYQPGRGMESSGANCVGVDPQFLGVPRWQSTMHREKIEAPELGSIWAGGYNFAHSDWYRLVPYHNNTPELFFGEEFFMSVRLMSFGFDIYSPTQNLVDHLYMRVEKGGIVRWGPNDDAKKSLKLVVDIMKGNVKDENFGMGKVRTWDEIQYYFGVDLNAMNATRNLKPWTKPENWTIPHDEFYHDNFKF